jgi:hypothetical protein
MNPSRGLDVLRLRPGDIITPDAKQSPKVPVSFPLAAKPVPAEVPKKTFQVLPGSEVYVARSSYVSTDPKDDGTRIDGKWTLEGEDSEGMKVYKMDPQGRKLVRHMTREQLVDLNRPTSLDDDITGIGQRSIDDLVSVIRRLKGGDIADFHDPRDFIPVEEEVQKVIAAYNGEGPLGAVTEAGYIKPVLEQLMRIRQVRGELGNEASMPAFEKPSKNMHVPGTPLSQGETVKVFDKNGKLRGGTWTMLQPNLKTGTVTVLQIVDNLPARMIEDVPLAELGKWNS